MNQTYLHLTINHLPVIGSLLGILVLVYGLVVKSAETRNAAYFIFILSAIGAGIAYVTGEAAEETAEHLAGVSEALIHEHEDTAYYALISMIVLGIMAIAGLVFNAIRPRWVKLTSVLILAIATISFGLIAYSASLGGKIRHNEVSEGGSGPAQPGSHDHEHDH